MSGAFVKGFNPQMYDLLGHNLKRDQLNLQKRRMKKKEEDKKKEMKNSGVREANYKKEAHNKFKDGYEKLVKDAQAFAQTHANELNPNNTATDNIVGEYNSDRAMEWQNMVRNIEEFAAHGQSYVQAYDVFEKAHKEQNEYGETKFNDSDVQRDNVYITKEMIDNKLEQKFQGRSFNELTEEEKDQFKTMWYGHDSENKSNYQEVSMFEGDFSYDENGYLKNANGGQVRAFERVGAKGNNPGKLEAMSGGYTYQRLFNEEYDPSQLSWTPEGDILYKGISYYKYYDTDYLKTNLLSEKALEVDAVTDFADELKFDKLRDVISADDSTEYLTDSAVDGLRNQAKRNSLWYENEQQWTDPKAQVAARQVAYAILEKQGITNPSDAELNRIIKGIQNGNTEGGLIDEEKDGDFTYLYGDKKGQKITHYNDLMAEQILENYMNGHAMYDKHYNQTSVTNSEWEYVYNKDTATTFKVPISVPGTSGNETFDSHVTNQATLGGKYIYRNEPKIFVGHNFGDNNQINDIKEIGMISTNRWLTDGLEGMNGSVNGGQYATVVINKNTGEFLGTVDGDNDSFTFNSVEDAENAVVVPVMIGSWKPENPGTIEADLMGKVGSNGLMVSDGAGGERAVNSNDIANALNEDKSVTVYLPLNSLVLTGGEKAKGVPSLINQSKVIQDSGLYYMKDTTGDGVGDTKVKYTSGGPSAYNDNLDLTFGGQFSV